MPLRWIGEDLAWLPVRNLDIAKHTKQSIFEYIFYLSSPVHERNGSSARHSREIIRRVHQL